MLMNSCEKAKIAKNVRIVGITSKNPENCVTYFQFVRIV